MKACFPHQLDDSKPTHTRLIITLGDPNGIGPELVARKFSRDCPPGVTVIAIGPEETLEYHVRDVGAACFWQTVDESMDITELGPGFYTITPEGLSDYAFTPGMPTPEGGEAAGRSMNLALAYLKEGKADALVTCPLNKAMLQEAGFDFPGHTELLAESVGLDQDAVCMHFYGPRLRVSLATTHPPLSKVPELITKDLILTRLRQTHDFFKPLGLDDKPIAVCGLNPHAGENGAIGREEIEIITPAIKAAQAEGIPAEGPFPADTIFNRAERGEFAGILAMYHDQGLPPFKLIHFNTAVNITLGLPFIRTSPAHGTAYDLVGRGTVEPGSFNCAVDLALKLGVVG